MLIAWDDFNRSVMGLNGNEAFAVACAIEDTVRPLHLTIFPPRHRPTQDLPDLLLNYSLALNAEGANETVDNQKVAEAVAIIHNSRIKDTDVYAQKLAGRVEFLEVEEQASLPKAADAMFGLAIDDAQNGSHRGFAWACFQLRQAFTNPVTATIDYDEALDLFSGLRQVPEIILDTYGEAGIDVAASMDKMLGKISNMKPADAELNL